MLIVVSMFEVTPYTFHHVQMKVIINSKRLPKEYEENDTVRKKPLGMCLSTFKTFANA